MTALLIFLGAVIYLLIGYVITYFIVKYYPFSGVLAKDNREAIAFFTPIVWPFIISFFGLYYLIALLTWPLAIMADKMTKENNR